MNKPPTYMGILRQFTLLTWQAVLTGLLLMQATTLHAGIEKFENRLYACDLNTPTPLFYVLDDKISTMTQSYTNWGFVVKKSYGTVFMGIEKSDNTYYANAFTVSCTLDVKYNYLSSNALQQGFKNSLVIEISYNPSTGFVSDEFSLRVLDNAHSMTIMVNSISSSLPGGALPNGLFIGGEINVERFYCFHSNFSDDNIQCGSVTATNINHQAINNNQNLRLTWDVVPGAEEYDLEWLYVDSYDGNGSQLSDEEINACFSDGATRITLSANYYEFPLVYETGYILYRVRPVSRLEGSSSYPHNFLQRIEGPWSFDNDGSYCNASISSYPDKYALNAPHMGDDMNWGYTTAFSEQGIRAEGVSYIDGLLRNRQSQLFLNTENVIGVGETFFDFSGRPAAQAMFAPGTQNAFTYQANFNLNNATTPAPFSAADFDLDNTFNGMSTSSGASRYYSPANPDITGKNAYIPDAEEYPFSRIEYMPDQTGRIRKIAAPGTEHTIGSGHETRFFYAPPTQHKVTRLFGTDAGFNNFYRETVEQDPNGQLFVTVKDRNNRVVITNLAGANPANLDPLASLAQAEEIAENLLNDNKVSYIDGSIINIRPFVVKSEGIHSFEYRLKPETFDECLPQGICYDCIYNLKISIINDDDLSEMIPGGPVTHTIGHLPLNNECDDLEYEFEIPAESLEVSLPVGSYTIIKELFVDQASVEYYANDYMQNSTCLLTYDDFLSMQQNKLDFSGCETDFCTDKCLDELGTLEDFLDKAKGNEEDYNNLLEACKKQCNAPNMCTALYFSMLTDVSPGGQYGELFDGNMQIDPSVHALSVYNTANSFPTANADWRNPILPYADAYGNTSYITLNDGSLVLPEDMQVTFEQFLLNWQSSWAKSLVGYHPEYCYYTWCMENESSNDYDLAMQQTLSFDEALDAGFFNPLNMTNSLNIPANTTNKDPFFDSGGNGYAYAGQMASAIDSYKTVGNSTYTMWEWAVVQVFCPEAVTENDINTCLQNNTFGDDTCRNDLVWQYFKGMYLTQKQLIYDQLATNYAIINKCYNGCIGVSNFDETLNDFDCFPYNQSPTCNTNEYDADNDPEQPCYSPTLYENKSKRNFTLYDFYGGSLPANPEQYMQDEYEDFVAANCSTECAFYAANWMEQLLKCNISYQDSLSIVAELMELCSLACTPEHPFPATSLPNPYTTANGNASIEEILVYHLGSGYASDTCTSLLINNPGAYNSIYNTAGEQLDTCGCNMILQAQHDFFNTNTGYASFPAYFANTYNIQVNNIKEYACRCNEAFVYGTSQNWEPGEAWNINAKNELASYNLEWLPQHTCPDCQSCAQLATAISSFETEHPYAVSSPAYYFLLANYLNPLWGYELSPNDYETFSNNCTELDNEEVVCDGITQEAADLQQILNNLAQAGKLLDTYQQAIDLADFYGNSSLQPYTADYYYWACAEPNDNDVCDDTTLTLNIGRPDTYTENCEIVLHIPANSGFNFSHITGFGNMQPDNTDCGTVHDFTIEVSVLANGISFTATLSGNAPCYPITQCYCEDTEIALCNVAKQTEQSEPDPCKSFLMQSAQQNAEQAYLAYYAQQKELFKQQFMAKCLNAASNEAFTIYYLDREHHYTLYYYDRAGNLSKTIAPKGTDMLTGQDINDAYQYMAAASTTALVPGHQMPTHYAYNTYNQVTRRESPDEGISLFWYDPAGRRCVSQDAEQAGSDYYSYMVYDDLDRITETGAISQANPPDVSSLAAYQSWLAGGSTFQVTRMYYDEPLHTSIPQLFANQQQENIRLRLATTAYYTNGSATGTNFRHATHYSYDAMGNVKEIMQSDSALQELYAAVSPAGSAYPHEKSIKYKYKPLSGNITEIHYGKINSSATSTEEIPADNYLHRYTYDKANRLKEVHSAPNYFVWNRDAGYQYYAHGPLARVETGEYQVQGTDYAYTLQGWQKGVNANTLYPTRDIGKDGDLQLSNPYNPQNPRMHTHIARDAFGYTNGFYNADYADIAQLAAGDKFEAATDGTPFSPSNSSLYNGDMRHSVSTIEGLGYMGVNYTYDQLYRLTGQTAYTDFNQAGNTWTGSSTTNDYTTAYTYDANGNPLELLRKGYAGAQQDMDEFTYAYTSGTNRLDYVSDAVSGSYYGDLPSGQTSANYTYNAIGNLTSDVQEEIAQIEWNIQHKITRITRTSTSQQPDLVYAYDATGNRTLQIEIPRTGSGISDEVNWIYTYFTYNSAGHIQAVYEKTFQDLGSGTYKAELKVPELPIYGHKRLGHRLHTEPLVLSYTFDADINQTTKKFENISNKNNKYFAQYYAYNETIEHERLLGSTEYELCNHTDNVLLTISDKKLSVSGTGVHKITESSYEGEDFPIFVTGDYSNLMSTNYAKTGSNSIRQTSTNGNGPRIRVNVKPGDDVDVTLYGLRSTNCLGTQHAGSVYVELYDCGTLVQSNNANLNNTYSNGQWHQLGISYTVPTGGSEQQYIEVYTLVNTGQCESYFDDVEVDITQNTDIAEYYTAEILSRQFYYPYGSTVPHPNNLNANQYRYGFGGYVGDKQSKSYHSYYRSYDARLTRWKSTDPVIQPWQSPYTAYNNNPIRYVDPLGNVALCALVGVASAVGSAASQVGMYALRGMPTIAFNMILNNTSLFAANEANGTGRYFNNGTDPTPYPKNKLGSVDYYNKRNNDFIRRNPGKEAPEYYLKYGNKYIQRFTNETNKLLSKQGKQWLVNACINLQIAMEDRLNPSKYKDANTFELDNKAFHRFAFDSHVEAYWDAGLNKLNTVDLIAILFTPNFEDLISEDGVKQAKDIMGLLGAYWLEHPVEGLRRGAELLANSKKIKAMVTAKALREGVNPNKAMPILDKIIESIPTIK